MNISSFIKTASNFPPHIAVLMRGSTGIGKSAIVKQIADSNNLPLVDVRGSTMTEGDVGGYPDVEAMKKNNIMTFCMPSWFVRACKEPVVLFLDELNRSLPSVQQSFFQLVLDRQLGNDVNGNPYNLHPETKIFAAVNHGNEYDVNDMDPALMRRFWVVDVNITFADWKKWASKNNVDSLIIDFLKTRSLHLAPDPSKFEPGSVFPTPASWARLDETLKYNNIDLLKDRKGKKTLLFNLSSGFIGKTTAIEFVDFIEKYEVNITPENVLNEFDKFEKQLKELSNDRINMLIERIAQHGKANDWNLSQGKNLGKFGRMISQEMLIHLWSEITETNNLKSIQSFHSYIGTYLVEVANSTKDLLSKK